MEDSVPTTAARSGGNTRQENEPAGREWLRSGHQSAAGDVYDDGYLRVEPETYYVACGGRSLKLPRAEFLLFSRMARSFGRFVCSEDLWQHVWGESKALNYESLHVYVYRLRGRFAQYDILIETMIGVGYRLVSANSKDDLDKATAAKC